MDQQLYIAYNDVTRVRRASGQPADAAAYAAARADVVAAIWKV